MAKYELPSTEEIKQTRLSLGFTQKEAADICTITPTTWARYEQGLSQIPSYIWELFTVKVAYTKLLESGATDAPRMTVYDKKKADREAEEQKKLEAKERYEQRMAKRARERQHKIDILSGMLANLKERVGRKYPQVHKDFLDKTEPHELYQAIKMIENYYRQYQSDIEALTTDLPPYVFADKYLDNVNLEPDEE